MITSLSFYHDNGFDPELSCNPTRTDAYFKTDAAIYVTTPPVGQGQGPKGGGGNSQSSNQAKNYVLVDRAECCGEYPIRFKYHTLDSNGGERACCGPDSSGTYKTFNSDLLECCATGEHYGRAKPLGEC